MEKLLKKWEDESAALFSEIQSEDIPTSQVRRKLAKLTQLNACISDLLNAMIKEACHES
jgi:hypothetical protein